MKDFIALKVLDRFKGIFQWFGVEYDVMRKILQIKLLMDGRRVPTVMGGQSNRKKEEKDTHFNNSLWLYGFYGLIMVPIILMKNNYIFQMSLVCGFILFLITTSLIADFSSVLLDLRDKSVLFSKPINRKTLNMAKTVHIFLYMFLITISLSGIPLMISLYQFGFWFFTLFLVEIFFMDLLIVVITALLYWFILRFFDGEKLKDIINYVQIALSIVIVVGYQLIGRLFKFMDIHIVFSPKWWQYFIVPIWYGAPFELLLQGSHRVEYIIFSILAFLVRILSIVIYIKLMPSFEQNLQKLMINSAKHKKNNRKLSNSLANIICSSRDERVFFQFACNLMKSERKFKLKVYPILGFSLIFPFLFLFNFVRDHGWESIASGRMYYFIYLCTLFVPLIVMMMKYSEGYKGAWIYKTIPIQDTRAIYKGPIKALLVKLMTPVFLLESILFAGIFGLRIIPDLVIVLLNLFLYVVICFHILKKPLPFSEAHESTHQKMSFGINILLHILLGFLAGIHYVCSFVSYGIYVYIFILIFINRVVWKKAFHI